MNSSPSEQPGSGLKSFVSIVLFIHLFLVFVALSSNLRAWNSQVQSTLVDKFAPYLTTLGLDPDFRTFHLTHGTPLEDDHLIEIDLKASANAPVDETIVLPAAAGRRLAVSRRRYLAMAKRLGVFADGEEDARSGELAKAIGGHFLKRSGINHVEVRCQRHETQPLSLDDLAEGFPINAKDDSYRQLAYAADVFVTDDGRIFVGKISSSRESAGAVPSNTKGSSQGGTSRRDNNK